MSVVAVAQATRTWLQLTWQIQVPQEWLDACIEWVMEEAGGVALPQAQINQQVLDQWLLTDLWDLAHPVLPAGVSQAQKMELDGCYCLQLDSLLDVAQPAYSQLQRVRGSSCSNDEVSAVTQATQKPWEVKPTRMLMLQLTDGVQSLEGMEYQPIPALSANLPPGTKLQVVGRVMVRLGVILLKPEHVNVLGGEVEQLVDRNSQSKMLCRTLGIPEQDHEQEAEDQEPQLRGSIEGTLDSGYQSLNPQTISEPSQTHQGSSLSPSVQMAPRESEPNIVVVGDEDFDEIPDNFDIPDDFNDHPDDFDIPPDDFVDQPQNTNHIPDAGSHLEDFDDIPMEELDDIFSPTEPAYSPSSGAMDRGEMHQAPSSARLDSKNNQSQGSNHLSFASRSPLFMSTSPYSSSSDQMEVIPSAVQTFSSSEPKMARYDSTAGTAPTRAQCSAQERTSEAKPDTSILNYLCILQAGVWPPLSAQVVRIHAFIVTLLGSLRSSGGEWKLRAMISDGTGYLDVDLSNTLLENLIGFSASESKVLRKDPAKHGVVDAGMQNCQRELVDMCCVMSVRLEPTGMGTVLRTDPLSDRECCELQRRVTDRRSSNISYLFNT